MRVCLLTHTFPRFSKDPAAPFMDGVASGIEKAGNEVFVLTPYSPFFKNTKRDYQVITYKYIFPNCLHKLGYSETLSDDKNLKSVSLLLSPLLIIFGTITLYRLVKKEKIDLINAHWILPNGFMAAIVSKLTGVPVVSTLPGSDVYMAGKNDFYKLMAKFAAATSKVVTSNSGQLLADLANITGVDLVGKSKVIIYGVDPEVFKPDAVNNTYLREKLSIAKNVPIVLGVGRLVTKKGFRYLIEAAPNVLKKYPDTVFVIVGDGDQRNALESLVNKKRISKNIRFTGSINYQELKNYYNLADISVLPSIRDEKGNLDDQSVSVIEAMACGKPVVTTDFPGYKLVIKNGVNGFLVSEKNTVGIEKALLKLISSSLLEGNIGRKNRETVVEKFSWLIIGRQYSQLFMTLVK